MADDFALKRVAIAAENTWSDVVRIGQNENAYLRIGALSGFTTTKVRARIADPDFPTEYYYSDDALAVPGQTFSTAFVPGPALVWVGVKTGEYTSPDSFTVTMRLSVRERDR